MNTNEATLEQQMHKGKKAAEVLENPIFIEASTAIRAKLFDDFSRTKHSDTKERDEIWRKLQMAEWYEKYIRTVMETGKLAEHTLLDKVKRKLRIA